MKPCSFDSPVDFFGETHLVLNWNRDGDDDIKLFNKKKTFWKEPLEIGDDDDDIILILLFLFHIEIKINKIAV